MSLQLAHSGKSIAELALQSVGFLHDDKYAYFQQVQSECETFLRDGESLGVDFRQIDAGPALLSRLQQLRARGRRPNGNIVVFDNSFSQRWGAYGADFNWLKERIDSGRLSWADVEPDIDRSMLSPAKVAWDHMGRPHEGWMQDAAVLARVRGELDGLNAEQRARRRQLLADRAWKQSVEDRIQYLFRELNALKEK